MWFVFIFAVAVQWNTHENGRMKVHMQSKRYKIVIHVPKISRSLARRASVAIRAAAKPIAKRKRINCVKIISNPPTMIIATIQAKSEAYIDKWATDGTITIDVIVIDATVCIVNRIDIPVYWHFVYSYILLRNIWLGEKDQLERSKFDLFIASIRPRQQKRYGWSTKAEPRQGLQESIGTWIQKSKS